MITLTDEKLRVALIAGSLTQGGAEKQLVYMAQALLRAGADVRIYSLTRGEYYEPLLKAMGVRIDWIGQYSNPISRLITLMLSLRNFKPHIVQSTHFFTNLYVGLVAPIFHAVGIGSIRSDLIHDLDANPTWGGLLVKVVDSIITNSKTGQDNAIIHGIAPEKIHYLPNVIDLVDFDNHYSQAENSPVLSGINQKIVIVAVGRMIPAKRFDRFISSLTIARQHLPSLIGILIGDGPERINLQDFSRQKGLSDNLLFLGRRDDIPEILRQADILILTSDHEGFPNVLLEAMSARLPVISTPAGDAGLLVQDGISGYVVPYDNVNMLVNCILRLANSNELRNQMGQEGRRRVEQFYSMDHLSENLFSIYQTIANQRHSHRLIKALSITRQLST